MLSRAVNRLYAGAATSSRVLRAGYAAETTLPKDNAKILVVGAGAFA